MAERKTSRRIYLKDFEKNADGSYAYRGTVYQYQGQAKHLLLIKVRLGILCACMLAALISAGCTAAPGMDNCIYVLLPYACGLLAGISSAWAFLRFCAGGQSIREYVYLASLPKLPFRLLLCASAGGLAVVGEAVFLLRNGAAQQTGAAFLFLTLEVIACICAMWFRAIVSRCLLTKFSP